jgi:mRNA-degrading endonuclease toxin of MazEF toxin-antitoxin module
MAVALTTSGYEAALPIPDDAWLDGGTPRRSYVLPWAVHSPQHADVVRRQGRLSRQFVDKVVRKLIEYVEYNET